MLPKFLNYLKLYLQKDDDSEDNEDEKNSERRRFLFKLPGYANRESITRMPSKEKLASAIKCQITAQILTRTS